jgi:adenylate cyclase
MAEERAKRKLSATLSADVEGYSRLMGEDELASVRTLETHREHQKRKEDEHGSQNHY